MIFRRKHRWNRRERIFLLEQLEMYVSAGLAVGDCLRIMDNEGVNGKVRSAKGKTRSAKSTSLEHVRKGVESGGLLSRALSENVGLSKSLSGIIEHGERVGGLAPALKSAHGLLVREDELIKKFLSAMMYPIVIGMLAVVLTIGLMRGVVPQIVPMLTSMRVELPFLTRVTIWFSGALVSYGVYGFILLVMCAASFVFCYGKSTALKRFVQKVVFIIPFVGKIVYLYSLSIFLRSFGTLVSSGIPIVLAYSEVVETISFSPLGGDVGRGLLEISNGSSLQNIFIHKNIPAHVPSLVAAGESSGSLGESLIRAASIIDTDLENMLKRLTSLIEPLMMVGVGGVVGAIALSIMMPIYDMSKILQHVH